LRHHGEDSYIRQVSGFVIDPMSQRPRVVVADDHPAVLTALTRILESHVDVVSVAHDGEELLQRVAELLPDVVVTDISMPKIDGLEACRMIRRSFPTVCVIIVSELLDDDVSAGELGANAVVRKIQIARELPAAVLALSGI
jgi:CheY-like chemotaxis protein